MVSQCPKEKKSHKQVQTHPLCLDIMYHFINESTSEPSNFMRIINESTLHKDSALKRKVYGCFTYMCVCAPYVWLLHKEVKKGRQVLWNWSYRPFVSK